MNRALAAIAAFGVVFLAALVVLRARHLANEFLPAPALFPADTLVYLEGRSVPADLRRKADLLLDRLMTAELARPGGEALADFAFGVFPDGPAPTHRAELLLIATAAPGSAYQELTRGLTLVTDRARKGPPREFLTRSRRRVQLLCADRSLALAAGDAAVARLRYRSAFAATLEHDGELALLRKCDGCLVLRIDAGASGTSALPGVRRLLASLGAEPAVLTLEMVSGSQPWLEHLVARTAQVPSCTAHEARDGAGQNRLQLVCHAEAALPLAEVLVEILTLAANPHP